MRPQARKAKAEGFPVPAADRTHVPIETKDFLSVLDLTHDELDRILDLAAELKRDRTEGRPSMQPLAGKHIGLIAQEVAEVAPEAVHKDAKGVMGIVYGQLVSVLVEATKELDARLSKLEGDSHKSKTTR